MSEDFCVKVMLRFDLQLSYPLLYPYMSFEEFLLKIFGS